MTDKEKAEIDIKNIEVFKRKFTSNFAHYKSLVLEQYVDGKTKLEIDEARCIYLTEGMFDFHLFGGIESAKKWFLAQGQTEDYQKALRFEEEAKKPNTSKSVMKYKLNNTLVICNNFKDYFNNGSLLRLMCGNAYPSGKEHLQKIIDNGIS